MAAKKMQSGKQTGDKPDAPRDVKDAERLRHGLSKDDKTGAPKGRNRSNAGEETS